MVLGIVLIVFGAIVFAFGVSAYGDRKSTAMPLLFRSLHQSTSRSMGIGLMVVGALIALVGVIVAFTA